MANDILKYTSRDYDSISTDLIDAIPALTDTWTSREDGDPGIVLVKEMSAIGDMLSYNLDKQALEFYGPTVTQRKNAAKLFELVGYNMHWYRSALTTVKLTYTPKVTGYLELFHRVTQAKTDQAIQDLYYEYRLTYSDEFYDDSVSYGRLPVPPTSNPQHWITGISAEGWKTPSEAASQGGNFEDIKTSVPFPNHALDFYDHATKVFNDYMNDTNNALELRTYIEDQNRQIDLYPNEYSGMMYSIVPSIDSNQIDENGNYRPTYIFKPFESKNVSAVQGTIKSVKFKSSQLQDNRFYLPEAELDEEHIYLCYNTTSSNPQIAPSIFIQRTENLLTESHINEISQISRDIGVRTEPGTGVYVYFQFRVDDFDYPYIELSSYWNTVIPENATFEVFYFKTSGMYGNITKNYLKRLGSYSSSILSVENCDTNTAQYDINGNLLSYSGKHPETAREGYINSLNHVMTFDSIVTIFDFERFTKRQEGFTNALAVDRQRMLDLNKKIFKECNSYTDDQLRSILGNVSSSDTHESLVNKLYAIRKVVQLDYNNPNPTVLISEVPSTPDFTYSDTNFRNYYLNMYPIYGNFSTQSDSGEQVALYVLNKTVGGTDIPLPYRMYCLNENGNAWRGLNNAFADVHIVSVEPHPTYARVFEWYCCGTLHLTKSVSEEDSKNIIKNVIDHLTLTFSASNVAFGSKITQMDVIQAVMEADPRIRYFDAGIGDKKVIVFNTPMTDVQNYFNVDAYFNPESIMRYTQTVENNENQNLLRIDTAYIQKRSE